MVEWSSLGLQEGNVAEGAGFLVGSGWEAVSLRPPESLVVV